MDSTQIAKVLIKLIKSIQNDFQISIERKGASINLVFSKDTKATTISVSQDILHEQDILIEECLEALCE